MRSIKPYLLVFTILLACSKSKDTSVRYRGEVIEEIDYCHGPNGNGFLIKYKTLQNQTDTFITASLPTPFKKVGQKIEFSFRDISKEQDEWLLCLAAFRWYTQLSIHNVKDIKP